MHAGAQQIELHPAAAAGKISVHAARPDAAPADGERMGILLELLDEVTTRVPVWRMGCDISAEAAEMAYRAMSGK